MPGPIWIGAFDGDLDPLPVALGEEERAYGADIIIDPAGAAALVTFSA
jgi:hypothetical protein